MARSVNMAILVGNLTRDPEMRYTPAGHAVTSFSVATNRSWVSDGREQEETDFHNIVTWNKLAETCNNSLAKGRKVYVKGRISTRSWEGQDGQKHYRTEIVADEVIFLDAPRDRGESLDKIDSTARDTTKNDISTEKKEVDEVSSKEEEDINAEEIPF